MTGLSSSNGSSMSPIGGVCHDVTDIGERSSSLSGRIGPGADDWDTRLAMKSSMFFESRWKSQSEIPSQSTLTVPLPNGIVRVYVAIVGL